MSASTAATLPYSEASDGDEWDLTALLQDPVRTVPDESYAYDGTQHKRRRASNPAPCEEYKPSAWTETIVTSPGSILGRQRGRKLIVDALTAPRTSKIQASKGQQGWPSPCLQEFMPEQPLSSTPLNDEEVDIIVDMLVCDDADLDAAISAVHGDIGTHA